MEIKAPEFPESISEGTVAQWHVQEGETARRDDLLVDIETDKVVIEVFAPDNGTLTKIVKAEGDTVLSEEIIGEFSVGEVATQTEAPAAELAEATDDGGDSMASPAARKLAAESNVDIEAIAGSGRDGRVTKEDVARAIAQGPAQEAPPEPEPAAAPEPEPTFGELAEFPVAAGERIERRVPMTRMRASIARRLVEAQHNAAMLTTFNEVDMSPVMALRRQYQDDFQSAHNGTRLGFMSFFVRACVEALKRFPSVNASIDGNDIVYHGYYDIGVAVSTERGLVVPVVREADALSFAQIEDQINGYGEKARSGKLTLEELAGGTFTISNGGVFGSLLSTPILNPPQTGVLGMHKIQERPVVVDGEVVVRPMMYLALSYDHRLIDGREAVQFLVAIKGMIEDPARVLLEL
jgi:2-oxoglutarate dehydrogenase E2 component (dihydrolipoamide succinyltransferase)